MKDSIFRIKIIEGKELLCEDDNGLADAYVILKFCAEQHTTQVIKDKVDP
jgi:Ca2+-dependent lipid-binding protein